MHAGVVVVRCSAIHGQSAGDFVSHLGRIVKCIKWSRLTIVLFLFIYFIFNEMMKIFFFRGIIQKSSGVSVVTVLKIITHQREVEEFSEGYWTL